MKLLNQAERRLYRWRIQPFFRYIIFAMAGALALQLLFPQFGLFARMVLLAAKVFSGEVWRLVAFLLIPAGGSLLNTLLMLYFYYYIGTTLESRWGVRRFLLFYAIGAVFTIVAGLLSGYGINQYLYLSMFFALAILAPEQELLLFFALPVKMKWLALMDAALYVFWFVTGDTPHRAAIVASVLHILLFFGGDIYTLLRQQYAIWQRRRLFQRNKRF